MNKPISHPTPDADPPTDRPQRLAPAKNPTRNAYATLLAISEVEQKELMNPSDDMRSQVRGLQQALSLFRLKS